MSWDITRWLLLPCPFCRSLDLYINEPDERYDYQDSAVHCCCCDCVGPSPAVEGWPAVESVAMWNERPPMEKWTQAEIDEARAEGLRLHKALFTPPPTVKPEAT